MNEEREIQGFSLETDDFITRERGRVIKRENEREREMRDERDRETERERERL